MFQDGKHQIRKEDRMDNPRNYRYTKEHEWASLEGDVATMCITNYDYAVGATGCMWTCPLLGRPSRRATRLARLRA